MILFTYLRAFCRNYETTIMSSSARLMFMKVQSASMVKCVTNSNTHAVLAEDFTIRSNGAMYQ
jgi:hypothetical protein